MKKKTKLIIALLVLLDLLLLALPLSDYIKTRHTDSNRQDELAQWVGEREDMSEEERNNLYAQVCGDALSLVYVQSECVCTDGYIQMLISNDERCECSVSMELVDLDSGLTLAQTGILEPDYHLEGFSLEEKLPAGTYHCAARLRFYWAKNGAFVGSAVHHVLLTVE